MAAKRGQASSMALAVALALLGATAVTATAGVAEDGSSWSSYDEHQPQGVCFTRESMGAKPEAVCCPGWRALPNSRGESLRCTPECLPRCENATCSQPGRCDCNVGFHRPPGKALHVCVPHCQTPCVKGDCVAPNTCRCWPGYVKSHRSQVCRSETEHSQITAFAPRVTCSPACKHGNCVATDVCECHAGFVKNPRRPSVCVPHCRRPCGHWERCTAPDHCACVEGYMRAVDGSCVPVCHPQCLNGRCVAPNKCECTEGYEEMQEEEYNFPICVPTCHPPCGPYGDCDEVNNCTCFSNYQVGPDGDCIGECSPLETWDRETLKCAMLPTTFLDTTPTKPHLKPIILPSSPPPLPLTCSPSCLRGECVLGGRCKCERKWAGENCSRTCKLAEGSLMVDAKDCPELEGCACGSVHMMANTAFCALDSELLCGAAANEVVVAAVAGAKGATEASPPLSAGPEGLPQWVLWVAAGAAGLALLILVVVPSAFVLHRRHRRIRQELEDDDRARVLHTQGAGRGRHQETEVGDDWRFTSY